MLDVCGEHAMAGERSYVVVLPDGSKNLLPAWMTEASAAVEVTLTTTPHVSSPGVEPTLPLPPVMAALVFVDSAGVSWRVWSTIPTTGRVLSTEFGRGWLTFDSGTVLRRLTPIPAGWESADAGRLELMCRAAVVVPRHTGPLPRAERPS